jgi:SMODS-associated NUDIX domain
LESSRIFGIAMSIRISAASICRIGIHDKYLLGLNKNRLLKGKRILTPLGGALEMSGKAREYFKSLGCQFEKGNDIRMDMPVAKVASFEDWFRKRIERETSPLRELTEELAEEYAVIAKLGNIMTKFDHTSIFQSVTDRVGQEGKVTKRFLEVFAVKFEDDVANAITEHCGASNSGLQLVSKSEIMKGVSIDGDEISEICMCLWST